MSHFFNKVSSSVKEKMFSNKNWWLNTYNFAHFAEDPLNLLYILTFGLFRFKVIQIVSAFTFILHFILSVVFFCEMIYTFDTNLLISYGPMIFVFGSVDIY